MESPLKDHLSDSDVGEATYIRDRLLALLDDREDTAGRARLAGDLAARMAKTQVLQLAIDEVLIKALSPTLATQLRSALRRPFDDAS